MWGKALVLVTALAILTAAPARAEMTPDQLAAMKQENEQAAREIEKRLKDVLSAYLSEFAATFERIQSSDASRAEKLVEFCSNPEKRGIFADSEASVADKLEAIEPYAADLGKALAKRDNARNAVLTCRGVAPVSEHYWAGAVFAVLRTKASKGGDEGDLVAAHYGSGILGAVNFGLAGRYLHDAGSVNGATDKQEILGMLSSLEESEEFYELCALAPQQCNTSP